MESVKRTYAFCLLQISLASDMHGMKGARNVAPCEFEEGRCSGDRADVDEQAAPSCVSGASQASVLTVAASMVSARAHARSR